MESDPSWCWGLVANQVAGKPVGFNSSALRQFTLFIGLRAIHILHSSIDSFGDCAVAA